MKTDIILCGVGGQGILSIATIIGEAAMKENLYIKQAEVHGMSAYLQQSHLQRSDSPGWCRRDYFYGTDGGPALSAVPG